MNISVDVFCFYELSKYFKRIPVKYCVIYSINICQYFRLNIPMVNMNTFVIYFYLLILVLNDISNIAIFQLNIYTILYKYFRLVLLIL